MQAFAHSAQPEMLDLLTFEAGLELGMNLAESLNLSKPVVMSQRDVPGLARGVVPLLARRGVIGISVGANDGSPAPITPSTQACFSGKQQVRAPFVWMDPASNTSVMVDIHPGGKIGYAICFKAMRS